MLELGLSCLGSPGAPRQHGDGHRRAALGARRVATSDLRLAKELEILASEMELDAKRAAATQAADVMKGMQSQLLEFVEAEEALCEQAEGAIEKETGGKVAILNEAVDASLVPISAERSFYPDLAQ